MITEPWRYEAGYFRVPTGPGLGVELDPDKVAIYHRYFDEHAEVNEFYDPWRPEWVPALPLFQGRQGARSPEGCAAQKHNRDAFRVGQRVRMAISGLGRAAGSTELTNSPAQLI